MAWMKALASGAAPSGGSRPLARSCSVEKVLGGLHQIFSSSDGQPRTSPGPTTRVHHSQSGALAGTMCPLVIILPSFYRLSTSLCDSVVFLSLGCQTSSRQGPVQEGAEDLTSTPPFITSMAPSQTELDFLIKGVEEDVRSDGRARTDYRYVVFS